MREWEEREEEEREEEELRNDVRVDVCIYRGVSLWVCLEGGGVVGTASSTPQSLPIATHGVPTSGTLDMCFRRN